MEIALYCWSYLDYFFMYCNIEAVFSIRTQFTDKGDDRQTLEILLHSTNQHR